MEKRIKITMALVASLLPMVASAAGDWKGKVTDDKGEPVAFANVVALSRTDSTVVAGSTTAEDGTFNIVTDGKDQLLMVSMIGYKTLYVAAADNMTVTLHEDAQYLEGAAVSAVIPKTTLTGEGLQTSVRGTVLETIGTANDVLSRTPGIIKSQDGLQVVGKGSPLVYINGRKVVDPTELDRLQSNEIQSVEVITNPGAQYSASVRCVVRIRTVKHQGDGFGFNAGITDEQSLHNGYNDQSGYLNANFRHNGLDIFAGTNALKYTSRQESNMLQQTFGTPDFKQEGTLDFVQKMTSAALNGGLNWQISDNHSLGFRVESEMNPRVDIHQSIDEDIFEGGRFTDHLISEGNHHNDDMPFGVSVNAYYNGKVGKLAIDFNADYYGMKTSQDAHTVEKSQMGQDDDVNYLSHSGSRMYAAKLVLSYPVWMGMLQAGTEDVFTRRNDDYTINSAYVPSSESKVSEDNTALFASYGFYVQKVGQISAGVRYEHVNYIYEDLKGHDDLSRRYDNVFPTLAYANAFGPVQMQLSYSAKTHRPDFQSLSSAVRYHSRYIYQSGNAKLQPQTNHDLGLNVNWKWLTMVTQYSHINGAISQWSELYNDKGVVLVHPINLDRPVRTLAWFVNAAPSIGIWTLNWTAGLQQQWLTLDMPDPREITSRREVSFSDRPLLLAQLFNTLRLKKDWQIEFGAEYHSKAYSQNAMITNNYLDITAAIQKTLLDNTLVLRLEGTDLAGLGRYDVMTDCGSHIIRQTNRMDTQRVKLSIRYNFNTAQSKYKGTGAGTDVKSRMK
ncbi:MAG: outer membrane beta-barrel protein [Bacteroidales bacterium]|nr:outer membrane beta-barrel protein [Candidatus Cryptobacteroides choladohippi]